MTTEPPISFSNSSASSTQATVPVKLKETVSKLMLVLSEKENYIIKHRFSINSDSKRTLESIGQHFGVTRERIRQIEKNALKKLKRNAFNTNLKIVNEAGKAILKKHGGLLSDVKLSSILLDTLSYILPEELSELKLSLTLDPEISRASNTLDFEPHWRFSDIRLDMVRRISQEGFKFLNERNEVIPTDVLMKKVSESLGTKASEILILSVLEIDKRIKFTKEGVGLKEWRHINPRTLRDKIHFIMEREHKPLHFSEIAEKIRELKFDKKNINNQAVHNELIRNEHFILIGRGIYALDRWGYQSGTVGDVILKILSNRKPRTREEIIKEVLKQRMVKKITIYLNLKNNPKIKSLGGDRYQLVKK